MGCKYMGRFVVTKENLALMHRRIVNFTKSRHFNYVEWHNFDVGWQPFKAFGVTKTCISPAKEVELHIPGCEDYRSDDNFVRVIFHGNRCDSEIFMMIYEGDEIQFKKDSITVKRAWKANGYTDRAEYVYSRLQREVRNAA